MVALGMRTHNADSRDGVWRNSSQPRGLRRTTCCVPRGAHRADGVGTMYYAYDLAGRRTLVQDWTGSATYYEHDKRGLITRVHSPAGRAQNQPAVATGIASPRSRDIDERALA